MLTRFHTQPKTTNTPFHYIKEVHLHNIDSDLSLLCIENIVLILQFLHIKYTLCFPRVMAEPFSPMNA